MEFLKSGRIFLRLLRPDDAADLFSYRSDPGIYRYQVWRPKTIKEAEDFLRNRIVAEPDLPGTWFQLAVCRNDTHETVGDAGIHFLENEPAQVEIGMTLKREHQGSGYATEALGLVFDYVFYFQKVKRKNNE